jgi:hypothetical protein
MLEGVTSSAGHARTLPWPWFGEEHRRAAEGARVEEDPMTTGRRIMPAKKTTARKAQVRKTTVTKAAAPRKSTVKKAARGRSSTTAGRKSAAPTRARRGDVIIIDSSQVGSPPREGEVLKVIQGAVSVSYQVKWADGHESLISPVAGTATIVRA